MYKIPLSSNLLDCPNYWQNYALSISEIEGKSLSQTITDDFFEKYSGRFYLKNGELEPLIVKGGYAKIAGIIFETEEDATAFILRWS